MVRAPTRATTESGSLDIAAALAALSDITGDMTFTKVAATVVGVYQYYRGEMTLDDAVVVTIIRLLFC